MLYAVYDVDIYSRYIPAKVMRKGGNIAAVCNRRKGLQACVHKYYYYIYYKLWPLLQHSGQRRPGGHVLYWLVHILYLEISIVT